MSEVALEFPQFMRLPAELRDEIWRYCLPKGVCQLDQALDWQLFPERGNKDGPWACGLHKTTLANNRPPVISRVCKESRAVAFETGCFLPENYWPDDPARPREAWCVTGYELDERWVDRARDSVHMFWDYGSEADQCRSGSPLHCLAWEASNVRGGASLNIDMVEHTTYCDDELRDLDAFNRLQKWLVVMRIIVVHCDLKTAGESNLFGLLADARVQVVDVSEEAKVEQYLKFAETCESKGNITVRQDFHRESTDSMEQKLRNVVTKRYPSESLAATMRPAIMFRLCTEMCNHAGSSYERNFQRSPISHAEHLAYTAKFLKNTFGSIVEVTSAGGSWEVKSLRARECESEES